MWEMDELCFWDLLAACELVIDVFFLYFYIAVAMLLLPYFPIIRNNSSLPY